MPNLRQIALASTLVLVAFLLPAAAANAEDIEYDRQWPEWRGPLRSGVAPFGDPPRTWSEKQNIRWKKKIPGRGLSTPLIWGDRVFLTTAIPMGPRPDQDKAAKVEKALPEWRQQAGTSPGEILAFTVLALDRRSGSILWQRTLRESSPHEGTHQDGSWASQSPVTDGEVLIAHFGSFGTYGLDLDGKLLWERDLGDMETRNSFGEGSSPTLSGDWLVINWDHEGPSFIVVLHRRTGKTLWQKDRDEVTSWSTPLVVTYDGRRQVVVAATARTRGYELETGAVLWEAAGMTTNTIPSPVIHKGRVFVMSGFRGNALQAIDLEGARGDITHKSAIAWAYDRDTPYVPSPLLFGDRLFFLKGNKGILSAFETRTGKKLYTERLPDVANVYASPVGADGRFYVVGRDGTTAVLSQASDRLQILSNNELDDGFDASPALAGDELFLRGHEALYCIGREP